MILVESDLWLHRLNADDRPDTQLIEVGDLVTLPHLTAPPDQRGMVGLVVAIRNDSAIHVLWSKK